MQGNILTRNFGNLVEGVHLVRGSPAWTPADAAAWRAWLEEYKAYLELPRNIGERCSMSNHGIYYDLQLLAVMRALGRCAPPLRCNPTARPPCWRGPQLDSMNLRAAETTRRGATSRV